MCWYCHSADLCGHKDRWGHPICAACCPHDECRDQLELRSDFDADELGIDPDEELDYE